MQNIPKHRDVCYHCYRPQSTCMCDTIKPIETSTQFVLLMHPKEFKHTKNGTGHFTHLSLPNSQYYVGIDFSQHPQINSLIHNPKNRCYVLYPSDTSILLNSQNIASDNKQIIIFLIDATWPCSRAMLRCSPNLDALPKVSFSHHKVSGFTFKEQPKSYCLSTMESTLCVLELLNKHGQENISSSQLENFLNPFKKMVKQQVKYTRL